MVLYVRSETNYKNINYKPTNIKLSKSLYHYTSSTCKKTTNRIGYLITILLSTSCGGISTVNI